MAYAKHDRRETRNIQWTVSKDEGGSAPIEHAQLAVLMDIRDSLQELAGIFRCVNFQQIPMVLRAIRANTSKPKKRPLRRAKAA